jgi:biopolymer transport protein ExbD
MNFGKDLLLEDESTDINVTSLVDVVLNLLFFFMVTTTFSETLGIKVNLPVTTTASVETVQKEITVSIKENGQVYLAESPIAVDSLPGAFGKLLSAGSRSELILRADEKVNHGRVVQVMDLAKKAGIKKIAIATAPKG